MIAPRQRRQGKESFQHRCIPGMPALRHQRLGMIGLLDIAVPLEGTDMAGEIELARVALGRFAAPVLKHRATQVVDPPLLRHAERIEAIDVRREKRLHRLRQRALDGHLPAVGQHPDEAGQAAPGVADGDGAEFAPVDLDRFAGGEGPRQKGFARTRADGAHKVLDEADSAAITGIAQAREDRLRRQRRGVEPADDAALEGIELARPADRLPRCIGSADPVAHGLDVQTQRDGELGGAEVFGHAIANGDRGGVVDQGRPPRMACRRSMRSATLTDSGRLSTWVSGGS